MPQSPTTSVAALGSVQQRVGAAERLMEEFAERTGIGGRGDSLRRYLWTDAYAVRAFVALHRRLGGTLHLDRALMLVDLVHHVLGRHRPDDRRSGWISGLDDERGERHPTIGGLRIGKPLPERRPDEPSDDGLEWERDGQYFHYLTRWMDALCMVGDATGEPRWCEHAVDLARTANDAFVHARRPGGPLRMHWKMSIDLSRPQVQTMGHMDPLDGLATLCGVAACRRRREPSFHALDAEIVAMHGMCGDVASWATDDPLGLGGLLSSAAALVRLTATGFLGFDPLLHRLLAEGQRGIDAVGAGPLLNAPTRARLAFRELGLAIGLQEVPAMLRAVHDHPSRFGGPRDAASMLARLESLSGARWMAGAIELAWSAPAARAEHSWQEHLDINSVMLAASLLPAD